MRTEDVRAPAATREEARRAERHRIRSGLRYCLWVFLGVRVGLTVVATLGVALLPALDPVGVAGWPADPAVPGLHNVVTAWERFDALWFLRIATIGYIDGDGSAVFFPLYPLLIEWLSPVLGGRPLAAALIVSNAAFFGALVAMYFLTASEWDEGVARRAPLFLAVFPTAFFFLAPYSEAPFLFFVLTSLWGARRGRWWIAGVAGALAAATRNLGLLMAPVLLVEAIHQVREGRARWPQALWSLLPGAATASYLLFSLRFFGDFLAPLNQQATWQREFSLPVATLWQGTYQAFRWIGEYPGGYHLLDWLLVAPALAAATWVALRTRPVYAVYVWASLLVPLSYTFDPRPFMSLPRFLLPMFPLFWAPAVWAGRRPRVGDAMLAASGAGLGLMTVLFVNWYFVF